MQVVRHNEWLNPSTPTYPSITEHKQKIPAEMKPDAATENRLALQQTLITVNSWWREISICSDLVNKTQLKEKKEKVSSCHYHSHYVGLARTKLFCKFFSFGL